MFHEQHKKLHIDALVKRYRMTIIKTLFLIGPTTFRGATSGLTGGEFFNQSVKLINSEDTAE